MDAVLFVAPIAITIAIVLPENQKFWTNQIEIDSTLSHTNRNKFGGLPEKGREKKPKIKQCTLYCILATELRAYATEGGWKCKHPKCNVDLQI